MTGYFDDLQRELVAAAARQDSADSPAATAVSNPPRRRRSRRVGVIAIAVLSGAGVPAAAVTVFKPQREPDGLVQLSEKRVIAEGQFERGPWQLVAYQSDLGFCLSIRLPLNLASGSSSESGGCGGANPGSLNVGTSSGGSQRHNAVAWGMAPHDATQIRVTAQDLTVTVKTVDDNAGIKGRFYVAEFTQSTLPRPVKVAALNHAGEVIARIRQ